MYDMYLYSGFAITPGEMNAYKKPIYFSLQANGKLFAKICVCVVCVCVYTDGVYFI